MSLGACNRDSSELSMKISSVHEGHVARRLVGDVTQMVGMMVSESNEQNEARNEGAGR